MWSQRDLSLKGKIVIVRSLALSQLLYATSVMYVPEDFIIKVDKDIQSFIWNNKPPKIKKSTMISDISQGGLKMPLFSEIVKAHKVMWIKRLFEEKQCKWRVLAHTLMGLSKFELICKFSHIYLTTETTNFYKQVLQYWYELHANEPAANLVHREIIWNNKFILIDNKPINHQYKHWQNNGITRIEDIINDRGCIISRRSLSNKYDMHITHMEYTCLMASIPQRWKDLLKLNKRSDCADVFNNKIIINNTYYEVKSLSSKLIEQLLILRISKHPTAIPIWIDEFPFLNDADFSDYFSLINKITKDTKIQIFQYKLLNRIIACQTNLKKWKITDHESCRMCGNTEAIEHLFFSCPHTKSFWKQLQNWFCTSFQTNIRLSMVDILVSIPYLSNAVRQQGLVYL